MVPRRDYDPAELGSAVYPLLNSVVVPRPIAWVSTTSPEGVDNLAPHSFFTISSWTNGKAERFNRTLLTDWAYAHPWTSNAERTAAFDAFLERYNTRRAHTALGGRPPISRLAA